MISFFFFLVFAFLNIVIIQQLLTCAMTSKNSLHKQTDNNRVYLFSQNNRHSKH